jgi:polo-like kinase 1
MGPTKSSQADVWVTKWVDYSTKYGMGYLLLNGATGVYYNDGTKIVLSMRNIL